ncbi:MAG: exosortase/archaeosortase family protein, partial [Candidatus Brocadiales bacterium]
MKIHEREVVLINYWPAFVVTALLVYIYLDTFMWMIGRWLAADSYYSHGFVVPFVSAYLIWRNRGVFRGMSQSDSWGTSLGLLLLVGGAGLHCAGALFSISFVSGLSLIPLLLGMVFYIYGSEVGWKLLFPILFLFAMIPLPMSMIADLSLKLKLFAAEVAIGAISLMGIVAVREGSFIHFSQSSLIVGDVCSGLRSLIALLAFGALFAYVSGLSGAMRAVLFISSVPIALVANSVRIVALCFIANQWGSEVATGRVHSATGILIFIVAFILFFALEKQLHLLEQILF